MVAKAGFVAKTALTQSEQEPYLQPLTMEPATRIERATCGLRTSEDPTSDNLKRQETTRHDATRVGADGAGLSCTGSSVVADSDSEDH